MKRLIVIALVLILAIGGTAYAKPAFGIKAGLNIANASVDDSNDPFSYESRTLFGIGGNVEFSISRNNNLTIRGDVMYMGKGSEGTYDKNGISAKNTGSVDELILAPFLVYRFPQGGFTPFVQGGPELGLNMTHKYKYSDNQGGSEKGNIKDWAGTDFSLNLGGGVAIPSGKGEVIVDARYSIGLSNMYTGSGSRTVKLRGIQLLVGYNFTVPTK